MTQPPRSRGGKRGVICYPACYDGGNQYQVKSLDYSQAMHSARLGNVLCNFNPMQQKFLDAKTKWLREMNKRHQDSIFQSQRTFFMTQVFDKGLNLYHTDPASPLPKTQAAKGETGPLPGRVSASRSPEMKYGTEKPPSGHGRQQKPPTPLHRAKTTGDLLERASPHCQRERDEKIGGTHIKRECHVTKSDEAGLNTVKTMVSIVNNPSSPVLPVRREITLPPLHSMQARPLRRPAVEEHVETPEPAPGEEPATPIIGDYLKPRGEKMTIARLRKSSAPIFPRLQKLLDDGPEDHSDSEGEVAVELPRAVEAPPADTRGHDVKLVQRLTAYLPQHVIKRAEDQIRQMSNSVEIYAQKKKLLESNRHQIEGDSTQDERWGKLYKKLSATHGLGSHWRKSNLPCKWSSY